MSIPILLLDCSEELSDSLIKQGFSVESGTIGYANGVRQLPAQMYEKDVIVYNPSTITRINMNYISESFIKDITPEFKLDELDNQLMRGTTCLVFVNRIADNIDAQRSAYSWLPFMPEISFTQDKEIIPTNPETLNSYRMEAGCYSPLLSKYDLKIPVLQKIAVPDDSPSSFKKKKNIWLYTNLNGDCIGALVRYSYGQLIILPEYRSNDDVIKLFLQRVIPKIYSVSSRKDLLVDFKSSKEQKIESNLQVTTASLAALEEKHEKTLENLSEARRKKLETINKDETAKLALKYLDLAYRQDDVALFYIYKLVEVIEKKFGGEKKTKAMLGTSVEHNFIGKVTNVSYGDVRHAPNPGEIIKPWSDEEISKCFKYAENIVCKYLAKLF